MIFNYNVDFSTSRKGLNMEINKIVPQVTPKIKTTSTILYALQEHVKRTAQMKALGNVTCIHAGKLNLK